MFSKKEFYVDEWLSPNSRPSLKEAINTQVSSEKKERLLKNKNSHIDYGYSFPGLNAVKQTCLKEVRAFYETHGTRARIADIGAGFGSMTWKLLASGGAVDAFETQKPTADELLRRIQNLNPYFWNEDNLEDILTVFPENALTTLSQEAFKDKYDFIWISQVLHFLTPDEIQYLNTIFQHILKPGGQIFIETNSIHTLNPLDHQGVLSRTYQKAKQEGLKCPGFLAINSATVIDVLANKVIAGTHISAYTQTEMALYHIPYAINAYGDKHLGPNKDNDQLLVQQFLNAVIAECPRCIPEINQFHQIMNLLDRDTIKECFQHDEFECESYFIDQNGEKIYEDDAECLAGAALVAFLKKQPKLQYEPQISRLSLFNEDPHAKLLSDIQTICKNKTGIESFIAAIDQANYSLALRKACAIGRLDLIKTILKYKNSLSIDINAPSSNGYTALDWIKKNNKVDFLTQERIISLLLNHGAVDMNQSLIDHTTSSNQNP